MPFARRSLGVLSRLAQHPRRHRRLAVARSGRCTRADQLEDPCRLLAASARGASSLSPVGVARTWLSKSADMVDAAEPRHQPIAPSHGVSHQMLIRALAQGVVLARKVLDASILKASTETPPRPQIGTEMAHGKTRARGRRDPAQGCGAPASEFRTGTRYVAILLERVRGWR
jgi:hypothetical protein